LDLDPPSSPPRQRAGKLLNQLHDDFGIYRIEHLLEFGDDEEDIKCLGLKKFEEKRFKNALDKLKQQQGFKIHHHTLTLPHHNNNNNNNNNRST
jgi:hypothetical protein